MDPAGQVAILGAGVMGCQIAALFAAIDVPVLLLDVTEELALAGAGRARGGPLITPCSFERGLPMLRGSDWVLEAVREDLEVKRSIWARVAPQLALTAAASSNTSGIPLATIAAGLPVSFRRHFLGVHFFNPPSKLPLVEVIATPETQPEITADVIRFLRDRLQKRVVEALDTPNFIANRIGAFFSTTAQRLAVKMNLTVEDVDYLTGPLIGMPRSGTYRLMDVIGLDVWAEVMKTLAPSDPRFEPQAYFSHMLSRGLLGDKTGGGFYKRPERGASGQLQALDLQSLTYHCALPSRFTIPGAETFAEVPERLRYLVGLEGAAGDFLRALFHDLIEYCYAVAPSIARVPSDLDLAMQWGFGWELGPFRLETAIR